MLKIKDEINRKFVDYYREVFKDDKLSLKIKELIAVGVALTSGCNACYQHHLKKARESGASDEEIREAVAVSEVVGAGRIRSLVLEQTEQAHKEK